ncbi:MAG: hypothetical protein ACRC1H_06065, partial [Caldilineaceae bacterium]
MPLFLLAGLLWLLLTLLLRRAEAGGGRRAWLPASVDVAMGGVLLLLVFGFFWRTLSGDVYQPADGGDLVSFLYPTWRFAASELAAGRLPLWNPALYGGMPFVGDIQAGFFYPPHLLMFLMRPDFPYAWLQVSAILHLYWAGLGVYVLLRTLRLPGGAAGGQQVHPLAALLGAVAFTFSDPLLIHLGNLNLIAVLAWLPWTMAAFHRALGARGWGSLAWAAGAALLYALGILAGHAQSMLYIALALAIYAILATAFAPQAQTWRQWARALGLLVLTGGLAASLAAPALLPALAHVPLTARAAFTYQDTVGYSLAPAQLIGLITPGFFGRGPGLHWGLWQRVELPYVGVTALLLALGAILLGRRAERRALLPWMGLALVGLLLGFGIYAIVHGWLTMLLPIFGQLRAPARALVLWALGVAVMAGVGADILARATVERVIPGLATYRSILRTGTLILAGVALPLLFVALIATQANEVTFLRVSLATLAIMWAALFWGATWALVAARTSAEIDDAGATLTQSRLAPLPFLLLAVALLFFDLSATGAYTDISPSDPTTGFRHPEIVAFLHQQAAAAPEAGSGPFR